MSSFFSLKRCILLHLPPMKQLEMAVLPGMKLREGDKQCLRTSCWNDSHLHRALSRVLLFVTLRTVARQAPVSMEFSRQGYRSGLPFPPPGDLPDLGIEPTALSASWTGRRILYHCANDWGESKRQLPNFFLSHISEGRNGSEKIQMLLWED